MTVPWTAAQTELCRRVGERAGDAGYVLTRREDGFDLGRDLTALTRSSEVRGRDGGRTTGRALRHQVRFGRDDVFTVTTSRTGRVGVRAA